MLQLLLLRMNHRLWKFPAYLTTIVVQNCTLVIALVGHVFKARYFVRVFVVVMLGMAVFIALKEQPGQAKDQFSQCAHIKNCVASYGTWICLIWGAWVS